MSTHNYLCITCGTFKDDGKTGYCINDHDDWLEYSDFGIPEHRSVVERAMKNFNLTEDQLKQALIKGEELKIELL